MFIVEAVLITFISFWLLSPTFKLSLWGDDWFAIFNYFVVLKDKASTFLSNFQILVNDPWGSQTLVMGLLFKLFGFNSAPYYILSYFLRLFSALTIYPLTYLITKSKSASFLATLFFSITTTGLDATNMPFNLISFMSIALFNLFLYFYIKQKENFNKTWLIYSIIFFLLAYLVRPIRMITTLPLIVFIEIFWIFQDRNKPKIKQNLFRIGIFSLIFLSTFLFGNSSGTTENFNYGLQANINSLSTLFYQKRLDFLFYPLVTIGNSFFPFSVLLKAVGVNSSQEVLTIIIFSTAVFAIFSKLIKQTTNILNRNSYLKFLLTGCPWGLVVYFLYRYHQDTFFNRNYILSLTFAGYILIFWFFLILKVRKKAIQTGLTITLIWLFLSFIISWWLAPTSILETTHRYLIPTAISISIFVGIFATIGKNLKSKVTLWTIILLLIFIQIKASKIYLNDELDMHNQQITQKIWSSFPKFYNVSKIKKPLVFYIEGDDSNSKIIYRTITFGLPSHMALLYGFEQNEVIPIIYWNEVKSAVTDGKVLIPYNHPEGPISIDQVYAFKLEGQDNLKDITLEVREKLKK